MKLKIKTLAINLTITLMSLAVGVAIAEIGVRIAKLEGLKKMPEGTHAQFTPTFFTIPDPVLGWANKPNAVGVWKDEGVAEVKINSDGLREPEIAKSKPANTLRIAILGDSFTLATQVEYEETFAKVVEAELEGCEVLGDRKIQTVNFGVNGYGTTQQWLTLQTKVWNYQPDAVMLAFFIGNDVTDNSKQLENNHYRPFFEYDENGNLALDTSFSALRSSMANRYMITVVDRLPVWLVNNVRLLQLLKKIEVDNKKRKLAKHFQDVAANNFIDPPDSAWEEAWKISEELLGKIAEEVRAKGGKFMVVTIGTPTQVHPEKHIREGYMQFYEIEDLFYPGNRVKRVGDRHNFPVLNLERDMQAYVDETGECLHGFTEEYCGGHWNQKGHRLAGEIMARNLCRELSRE